MIIAQIAVTAQQSLQDRLSIDRVLESHSHVYVVERRRVHQHRVGEVSRAADFVDHYPRLCLEMVQSPHVGVMHDVDLAGLKRTGARGHIDHVEGLHLIEIRFYPP